jgi:hypothetical protein
MLELVAVGDERISTPASVVAVVVEAMRQGIARGNTSVSASPAVVAI